MALKKGAVLFKMSSVKKYEIIAGGQEMAWWYRVMAKILMTKIQSNFELRNS